MKLLLHLELLFAPDANLSDTDRAVLVQNLSDNLVAMIDLAIAEGAVTGRSSVELAAVEGNVVSIEWQGRRLVQVIKREFV